MSDQINGDYKITNKTLLQFHRLFSKGLIIQKAIGNLYRPGTVRGTLQVPFKGELNYSFAIWSNTKLTKKVNTLIYTNEAYLKTHQMTPKKTTFLVSAAENIRQCIFWTEPQPCRNPSQWVFFQWRSRAEWTREGKEPERWVPSRGL